MAKCDFCEKDFELKDLSGLEVEVNENEFLPTDLKICLSCEEEYL